MRSNPETGRLNGLALCAGVGGLELALKLALGTGYRCLGYVEREGYAAATLVARMEDETLDRAPIWDDISTFDGRPLCGLVDLVSAGYPCQPFSLAGSRLGENDERHLWPHVARIIREVEPRFVFLENVPGHHRLGFDQVLDDLAEMGFDAKWGHLSAAAVGASHNRQRLFCLAYSTSRGERRIERGNFETRSDAGGRFGEVADTSSDGRSKYGGHSGSGEESRSEDRDQELADTDSERSGKARQARSSRPQDGTDWGDETLADTDIARLERARPAREEKPISGGFDAKLANAKGPDRRSRGEEVQSEEGSRRGGLGSVGPFPPLPTDLEAWAHVLEVMPEVEPALCGVAHGMAYRVDRLRACGNGVVPVVAAVAFMELARRIEG